MNVLRLACLAIAAIAVDAALPLRAAEPPATAPTTAPATAPATTQSATVPTTMPAFVFGVLALPDGVTPLGHVIVSARATDAGRTAAGAVAQTDDDGSFVLNHALRPGTYDLSMADDGTMYSLMSVTITPDTGPTALRLNLPAGSLSGHVITAAALPAAAANVIVSDRASGHRYYGKTDAQGDYHFKYVLPGTYEVNTFFRVAANGNGFQTADVKGVVVADEEVELDLQTKALARRILPTKPPDTTVN